MIQPAMSRSGARRGLLVLGVVLIAACGGSEAAPERPRPPTRFVAGEGARSAIVLPGRGRIRRAPVIFFHGWGLTGPAAYRGWLRHLAGRGSTVIVPRYQSSRRTASGRVAGNALAGVRAALRRLPRRPREVVVAGHSAGGILALDYAVRARRLGLPAARAALVVYPGAALRDMPPVPLDDLTRLPRSLRRLSVMASPVDDVVGTGPAQAIFDGAVGVPPERRRLVLVADGVAGDHFAPVTGSAAARRTFWQPLDRLIEVTP